MVNSQAAMLESVPIIDVEALVRRKGDVDMPDDPEVMDVVRQIDQACREIGFFYVKGHGVPPQLVQAILDVGHEFFSLPEAQKLQIGMKSTSAFRQRIPEAGGKCHKGAA